VGRFKTIEEFRESNIPVYFQLDSFRDLNKKSIEKKRVHLAVLEGPVSRGQASLNFRKGLAEILSSPEGSTVHVTGPPTNELSMVITTSIIRPETDAEVISNLQRMIFDAVYEISSERELRREKI